MLKKLGVCILFNLLFIFPSYTSDDYVKFIIKCVNEEKDKGVEVAAKICYERGVFFTIPPIPIQAPITKLAKK